ncbi:MAG: FHA domain-containing protein [Bdellovibrio sp.]|nr:FHA domain-containing protein [Bdellovibrio sp.]
MNVLEISRGGLELAIVKLNKPLLFIGRSPTCDVVLRAQGIAPFHFLFEWIGEGSFDKTLDPATQNWSIFDVSRSKDVSGEGVLMGSEPVSFQSFIFRWIESKLEDVSDMGGAIKRSFVGQTPSTKASFAQKLVEYVQVRTDSGSIEEVLHLSSRVIQKTKKITDEFPEFKIALAMGKKDAVRILLEELRGAKIYKKGEYIELTNKSEVELSDIDLVQVSWRGRDFYLRWVDAINVPKIERKLIKDPLLLKLSIGGVLAFVLLLFLVWLQSLRPKTEEVPALRVATVELQKVVAPLAPPMAPPKEISENDNQIKEKKNFSNFQKKDKVKDVGASKFRPSAGNTRAGLNAPAQVKDFNAIGVLGALKKSGGAPSRVSPDLILNQGIVTESVSGQQGNIVLKNFPSGIVSSGGTKSGGGGTGGAGLMQAATTLKGKGEFSASSVGAIGRPGGSGSGGGELGKDIEFGKIDEGVFQVSGGLDRETVRRVIFSYRGQIRSCYERALVVSPRLGGRLVFRWDIAGGGNVIRADVKTSETSSSALDGCVLGVIEAMKFPQAPSGRGTTVIYPFVFQKK